MTIDQSRKQESGTSESVAAHRRERGEIHSPGDGNHTPRQPEDHLDYLRLALWACFVQAGGDTDGCDRPHMNDESLIRSAVDAVKSLREDYDELLEGTDFE